jgi:MYXO-CTERM domain-containing protein
VVGVHGTAALAPFLGTWVVVDLTVLYGPAGHLDMTIRRLAGGQTLLSYAGDADTWQGSDTGHDPKFGLYRSLASKTSLRDEQVRFADFCVSKVSAAECDDGPFTPPDAGPDAARADVGVAPSPDAAAPPPDVAPPRADTAIVIPPPPPDAGTVTPPADAAVVVPPPVDAASTPPPKLDAAVAGPAPDAATPDARLDPPDQATRPPDAATPATVTPDAAAGAAPDDGAPVAADGATSDPVGPTGGGAGRARRPGQRGCQLAAGAEAGWPWPVALLLAAALALHRRRR